MAIAGRETDPGGAPILIEESSGHSVKALMEPVISETPSEFDRGCMSIPIVGRLVAWGMKVNRRRRRGRDIGRQIAGRRHSTKAAWGNDPRRQQLAATLGEAIRAAFAWPNAHFLPEDRLELLMRWPGEGRASDSLRDDLAKQMGINTLDASRMTLGQLVDHIMGLPRKCSQCGYDLRATPERCPECGKVFE